MTLKELLFVTSITVGGTLIGIGLRNSLVGTGTALILSILILVMFKYLEGEIEFIDIDRKRL